MPKTCPIVNGEARSVDEFHYNLYCATRCDVTFPKGCDLVCGWPEMKQVSKCKARLFCPCRDSRGLLDADEKRNFVREHKGNVYTEPVDKEN